MASLELTSLRDKELWVAEKKKHLQQIYAERAESMKRVEKARLFPAQQIVIGIDRKNSIRLPMENPMKKNWMTKQRAKYEILSLLNYATEENTIFHGLDVFGHDSNITLTLLYRYICFLESIPNKLILYMDNCFKKNKNIYIFAFCLLLVEKNIFEHIEMHFLPPGHTHDRNDACFVPVALGERKFNCFTSDDFDEFAKQCFKNYEKKPSLSLIQNIYD